MNISPLLHILLHTVIINNNYEIRGNYDTFKAYFEHNNELLLELFVLIEYLKNNVYYRNQDSKFLIYMEDEFIFFEYYWTEFGHSRLRFDLDFWEKFKKDERSIKFKLLNRAT